jgi:hypothetical protein
MSNYSILTLPDEEQYIWSLMYGIGIASGMAIDLILVDKFEKQQENGYTGTTR